MVELIILWALRLVGLTFIFLGAVIMIKRWRSVDTYTRLFSWLGYLFVAASIILVQVPSFSEADSWLMRNASHICLILGVLMILAMLRRRLSEDDRLNAR